MWVRPVAKCPPARVAIQPPSVEYSKDCGKCRSVSPRSRSWSSRPGPSAPAWIRAAREVSSTSSTRSSALRSSATAGSSKRGSIPPTTLVPPPNGIAFAPASAHQASTCSTSSSVRGAATTSGALLEVAAEAAHDVAVGLAERVHGAVVALGRTDRGERRRRLDARLGQDCLLELHRPLGLGRAEAEMGDDSLRGFADLLVSGLLVLEPPAPVL